MNSAVYKAVWDLASWETVAEVVLLSSYWIKRDEWQMRKLFVVANSNQSNKWKWNYSLAEAAKNFGYTGRSVSLRKIRESMGNSKN